MKTVEFLKKHVPAFAVGGSAAVVLTFLLPLITFDLPSVENAVHFISDNSVLIIGVLLLINILLVLKRLIAFEEHTKAMFDCHISFQTRLEYDLGALYRELSTVKLQHKSDYDLSKQAWDEMQKALTEVPTTYATLQSTAAMGDRLIGMIRNHSVLITSQEETIKLLTNDIVKLDKRMPGKKKKK